MIEVRPIFELYILILILFDATAKGTFQLAKMPKIRDFNVDFRKLFWGHSGSLRPPYWGRATAPLPDPISEGAPRLPIA